MADPQTPSIELFTTQTTNGNKTLWTLIRETKTYAWTVAIAGFYQTEKYLFADVAGQTLRLSVNGGLHVWH